MPLNLPKCWARSSAPTLRKNLSMRVDAEHGATAGKTELAAMAKKPA